MIWYYTNNEGAQLGPVEEPEFNALVKSGVVRPDTYVWRDGLPNWIKYSEAGKAPVVTGAALGTNTRCSECGAEHTQDEMVNFSGTWVCAACKPIYVQKLREGAPTGLQSNGWRDGKRLVMPVNTPLQQRCIKCNQPTDDKQKKRKLYWHSPLVYLVIFLPGSLLLYVIVALCCRKTSTTFVSVCPTHRASRRNVLFTSWFLILGGFTMLICGLAQSLVLVWGLGIAAFLIGMIYGIASGRLVYAAKINKEYMWLGGCKPAFLADLPEWTGPK